MKFKIGQKVVFVGTNINEPTAILPKLNSVVTIGSILGIGYIINGYEMSTDDRRQRFDEDTLRPIDTVNAISDLIEEVKKSQSIKETEVELIPETV